MNERIKYIDALRGFAVVLMVQQHLISWLWNKQWISYGITFPEHPIMLSFNFLGNFSAAIFLMVSGIGSAMLYDNNTQKSGFFKRGFFILTCGYLLNLISLHWFKPGSWYILHTIGFAIIIAPYINRIKTSWLYLLSGLFIFAAPLIQTWLNTPLMLGNNYMNNASLKGGVFRLIFAEGHFPLFPWIGVFIFGIICQRLILADKKKDILIISIILISAGSLFRWYYIYGFFFATGGRFFRYFVFTPYIYPPLISFILIIDGIVILMLYIFMMLNKADFNIFFKALSPIGKLSLSWFFIHIIIFNEICSFAGIKKSLNELFTFLTVFTTLVLIFILSVIWENRKGKFSMEWIMRRVIKL